MRDAKDIISSLDKVMKPAMIKWLKEMNPEEVSETLAEEFSAEFEYILRLAEMGASVAAGDGHHMELAYDEESKKWKIRSTEHDIVIQCDTEEDHARAVRMLNSAVDLYGH